LNAAGHSVSMVPNGREALTVIQNSIIANTPIDLLVTDIAMPEMSGEELIVALRSQSIQIPIAAK
jgi:CheY-like chemotaxis protein